MLDNLRKVEQSNEKNPEVHFQFADSFAFFIHSIVKEVE